MQRFAVIDVGTNSVKLLVGERSAQGCWRMLVNRTAVTRLGEGLSVSGGEFRAAAMEGTRAAIAGMVNEAKRAGAGGLVAVGTMGMRTARNRDRFIDEVSRCCGIRIEVIPAAEEARLAYLAVQSGLGLPDGSLAIFDSGGGSTQFTLGHGTSIGDRFSLNVGAVRYTEAFGLSDVVPPAVIGQVLERLAVEFARLDGVASPDTLVGLGGAVTTLTAVMHGLVDYDPGAIQGSVLGAGEVDRQIEVYRSRTPEERRRIPGLQPQRAEVILAGACIVRSILSRLRKDSLTVSDYGLRHGLLFDRFGR